MKILRQNKWDIVLIFFAKTNEMLACGAPLWIIYAMNVTDTHTHLDYLAADGRLEEALRQAKLAGVVRMITCSTVPSDWNLYRSIAESHSDIVSWQIGLHPTELDQNSELALDGLASFFTGENQPCAVGEIGMDFYSFSKVPTPENRADAILQEKIFRRQIRLASELEKPVCVHARSSFADCVRVMREENFNFKKAVFHCFSEGRAEVEFLCSLGARASFTGIVTYKKADSMREAMLAQGPSKIMFETDCPYLAPVPHRGSVNYPAYIVDTVGYCAPLFGMSADALADLSTANAFEFFGL